MSNLNLIISLLPSVDLALPQGLRAKKSATGWRKENLAPFLEQAVWVKSGKQEEEERQSPSYITDNL